MSWFSGGWVSVSWFSIDWFKLALSGVEQALAGAVNAVSSLIGNLLDTSISTILAAVAVRQRPVIVHSRNRRRR